MGIEYSIKFIPPDDYFPTALFERLPSPIDKNKMPEIYNYAIKKDGFYFIDNLVNQSVASVAFRLFIDEALKNSRVVQISEL